MNSDATYYLVISIAFIVIGILKAQSECRIINKVLKNAAPKMKKKDRILFVSTEVITKSGLVIIAGVAMLVLMAIKL